jgi:hypothetical protein
MSMPNGSPGGSTMTVLMYRNNQLVWRAQVPVPTSLLEGPQLTAQVGDHTTGQVVDLIQVTFQPTGGDDGKHLAGDITRENRDGLIRQLEEAGRTEEAAALRG